MNTSEYGWREARCLIERGNQRYRVYGFIQHSGSIAIQIPLLPRNCSHFVRRNVGLERLLSQYHAVRRNFPNARLRPEWRMALLRRLKAAFDPAGILNPGKIF